MRIISKFKDYYDCVQKEGVDQSQIWIRRIESYRTKKTTFEHNRYPSGYMCDGIYYIGFCGHIFNMICINGKYLYSKDEYIDFFKENLSRKKFDKWYYDPWISQEKYISKIFLSEHSLFDNVFINYKCPVFIIRNYYGEYSIFLHRDTSYKVEKPIRLSLEKTTKKLCLANIEFFRIKPVQQAYQEINQYMTGVLGFNNPHVPIPSDKDMVGIKGFDKYSFRKEKSS